MKIFLIAIFLMASPVTAGIYKWTDEKGNVHFGDRPVNQGAATELIYDTESRAGITNSSGNNKERNRMAKELEDDRKERQNNREERRIAQKKAQKRCARSKDQLRQYQRASSIYKLKNNGDRVYYSKEEREAKEKKISKSIAKYCH